MATMNSDQACHHCGGFPDADGDHSCPCPLPNSECLEHTLHPVLPAVLTGQVQVDPWPTCPSHREVQHRDGRPPWCEKCGWNRGQAAVEPRRIAEL